MEENDDVSMTDLLTFTRQHNHFEDSLTTLFLQGPKPTRQQWTTFHDILEWYRDRRYLRLRCAHIQRQPYPTHQDDQDLAQLQTWLEQLPAFKR